MRDKIFVELKKNGRIVIKKKKKYIIILISSCRYFGCRSIVRVGISAVGRLGVGRLTQTPRRPWRRNCENSVVLGTEGVRAINQSFPVVLQIDFSMKFYP